MVTDPLAIVSLSFLARAPRPLVTALLDGGKLVTVPAGKLLRHRPGIPGVAIVLDGLVRVFLRSPKERQVTVRYARPGETLGLVHLFGGRLEVHSQAVTATNLWALSRKRVRALAEESPALAVAVAEECAARVGDAVEEVALLTFGSVRQHVARHLLDLAEGRGMRRELVADVTHQDLADATGSVREVVARVLKELHALGLTRSVPGAKGVFIVDATGLDAEARSFNAEPPPTPGRRSRTASATGG